MVFLTVRIVAVVTSELTCLKLPVMLKCTDPASSLGPLQQRLRKGRRRNIAQHKVEEEVTMVMGDCEKEDGKEARWAR